MRMDGIGDSSQSLKILESAWKSRDARVDVETHWREIMRGFGSSLLFN